MIYKYLTFNENAISCLINKEIWMSKLREFNDPFESLVSVDFENAEMQILFEKYIEDKVVHCFSECNKNILMWSHYADKHRGFCIGIDETEFLESGLLAKVIYDDIDPEIKNEIISVSRNNPKEAGKVYEKLITHKHKDWAYEKEQRLILNARDSNLLGRTYNIKSDKFKKIYFGCKMPERHKKLIVKIMGSQVRYYQARTSNISFSLELDELNLFSAGK